MMIPRIDDASAGRFRVYLLPSPPTAPSPSTAPSTATTQPAAATGATGVGEQRGEKAAEEGDLKGYQVYEGGLVLVWDRKIQGGFPEMRILKQKVRDLINPTFHLGHSDKP